MLQSDMQHFCWADLAGRTVSVTTLTNAFRCLIISDRLSLVPALYLCIDKIAPSYSADVAPIAVGHSVLSKAIMVRGPHSLNAAWANASLTSDC